MRGVINQKVKERSEELLGREICQKELRLLPYLMDCAMNNGIDMGKISQKELFFIHRWIQGGLMDITPSGHLEFRKSGWKAMCELVFLGGYVKEME